MVLGSLGIAWRCSTSVWEWCTTLVVIAISNGLFGGIYCPKTLKEPLEILVKICFPWVQRTGAPSDLQRPPRSTRSTLTLPCPTDHHQTLPWVLPCQLVVATDLWKLKFLLDLIGLVHTRVVQHAEALMVSSVYLSDKVVRCTTELVRCATRQLNFDSFLFSSPTLIGYPW